METEWLQEIENELDALPVDWRPDTRRLIAAVREYAARAELLETVLRTLAASASGMWESEALDGMLDDEDDPWIRRFNEALGEAEDALRVVGGIHASAG